MSESKLIIPAIGKVRAKVETTSGTKETLLDGNAVFFEELEWQYASLAQLPAALDEARTSNKKLLVGLSGAET